jgi:hypothetical protein
MTFIPPFGDRPVREVRQSGCWLLDVFKALNKSGDRRSKV